MNIPSCAGSPAPIVSLHRAANRLALRPNQCRFTHKAPQDVLIPIGGSAAHSGGVLPYSRGGNPKPMYSLRRLALLLALASAVIPVLKAQSPAVTPIPLYSWPTLHPQAATSISTHSKRPPIPSLSLLRPSRPRLPSSAYRPASALVVSSDAPRPSTRLTTTSMSSTLAPATSASPPVPPSSASTNTTGTSE